MTQSDAKKWQCAMNKEIDTVDENKTWILNKIPIGRQKPYEPNAFIRLKVTLMETLVDIKLG